MPRHLTCLFDTLQDRAHDVTRAVVGIAAPSLGVSISYVEAISAWVRLLALIVGCGVSLAMLVSLLRGMGAKLRQERAAAQMAETRLAEEEARLCAECLAGHRPARCPLDPQDRPGNCPLRDEE